jgi:hypothetical protein
MRPGIIGGDHPQEPRDKREVCAEHQDASQYAQRPRAPADSNKEIRHGDEEREIEQREIEKNELYRIDRKESMEHFDLEMHIDVIIRKRLAACIGEKRGERILEHIHNPKVKIRLGKINVSHHETVFPQDNIGKIGHMEKCDNGRDQQDKRKNFP